MELPPVLQLLTSEIPPNKLQPGHIRRVLKDKGFLKEASAQAGFSMKEYESGATEISPTDESFRIYPSASLNPLIGIGKCNSHNCREEQAKSFARSIGLYCDQAVLADYISPIFLSSDLSRDDPARVLSGLRALHILAPMVRAGVIRFSKPVKNVCKECSLEIKKDLSEKLWKIILKDGEVEFHSLDKDKLGCYLSSSLHTVDGTSIGTTYTFPAEVAKIIPSQQGWIKLKNLPKDTFSHLKEETISKLAREAILVSGEAKEAAARAAVLVTNRRQDAIALRTADKEPVSKSIENWETLRSVHLPWVSNLSVEEVLQLRDKAGDALPKFRDRMNRELFRISENDSRDKVSIQVTKALREEANELDADLRAAAKKTGHAGHIGIAVTGISCIIYGVGANIPALAGAGAALTTALCSMYHPSKNAHAEYAHLKTRSAYVLLSAREIIRRRKHA